MIERQFSTNLVIYYRTTIYSDPTTKCHSPVSSPYHGRIGEREAKTGGRPMQIKIQAKLVSRNRLRRKLIKIVGPDPDPCRPLLL